LTSLTERLRVGILNVIVATVSLLLRASRAVHGFLERIRLSLLKVTLSLVYFLEFTPIAWRQRMNPKNEISKWNDPTVRIGWHTNEQSTSDPETYRSMSSHDELTMLTRKGMMDKRTLLAYDIVRPLNFLAKPPKEKELSSDLYIMF